MSGSRSVQSSASPVLDLQIPGWCGRVDYNIDETVDGGFWVAASNPTAAYKPPAGTGRLTAGTAWRAALLTDGASAAVDTYDLVDRLGLLNLLDAGPERLA